MSPFTQLPRSFRFPWRTRDQIRAEVDEELSFHLDMRTEALVRGGMAEAEARARAGAEFGDVDEARRARPPRPKRSGPPPRRPPAPGRRRPSGSPPAAAPASRRR